MTTGSSSSSSNASSTLHLANCNAITMQQGVVEVTPACHLLIRGKRILYVGSSAPPPPSQRILAKPATTGSSAKPPTKPCDLCSAGS
ncbi:unnamed protein product [Sphagnum tenellum]